MDAQSSNGVRSRKEKNVDFQEDNNMYVQYPEDFDSSLTVELTYTDPVSLAFDNALVDVGEWGNYQRRLWVMITLMMETIVELNLFFPMFSVVKIEMICADDLEDGNCAFADFSTNLSATSCERQVNCSSICYKEDLKTLFTEFAEYCDYHTQIGNYMVGGQFVGMFLGALIWAQLSDMYGRKRTFFIAFGIQLICGIIASQAGSLPTMIAFFSIVSFCAGGCLSIGFVLVQEVVGSTYRVIVSACNAWYVAVMINCLIFYLFKNWRHVMLFTNCTGIPMLLFGFFIYESPRWLVVKYRFEEAEKVFAHIARSNETRQVDLSVLVAVTKANSDKNPPGKIYTAKHLFFNKNFRNYTFALAVDWFGLSLCMFALVFNVKELPGNRFFNGFIQALCGGVGLWSLLFWNKYFGRRHIHLISVSLGTIFCIFITIMELADKVSDHAVLVTIFALITSMGMGPAWAVVYLYTVELYPTPVRNLACGFSSAAGRLGGILVPLIVYLYRISRASVFALFSLVSIFYLLVSYFLLPETRNTLLHDIFPDPDSATGSSNSPSNRKKASSSSVNSEGLSSECDSLSEYSKEFHHRKAKLRNSRALSEEHSENLAPCQEPTKEHPVPVAVVSQSSVDSGVLCSVPGSAASSNGEGNQERDSASPKVVQPRAFDFGIPLDDPKLKTVSSSSPCFLASIHEEKV